MTSGALTHQYRFRVEPRWFSKPLIVLQVQERHSGQLEDDGPVFDKTIWRDAVMEDLTELLLKFKESGK